MRNSHHLNSPLLELEKVSLSDIEKDPLNNLHLAHAEFNSPD